MLIVNNEKYSDDDCDIFKSCDKVIEEREIKVTDYRTIDKNMLISSSSSELNDNSFTSDKLLVNKSIPQFISKHNYNDHNKYITYNTSKFDPKVLLNNKEAPEKITKLLKNCEKIKNLVYAKFNIQDKIIDNNDSAIFSIKRNPLNIDKYNNNKITKKVNDKDLSKFYFEYTKKYDNDSSILFTSNFINGNLYRVFENSTELKEFDIILQNDINTLYSTGWFYFKVTGFNKGDKIKLNILNLTRSSTLLTKKGITLRSTIYNEQYEKELIIKDWYNSDTDKINFSKNDNNDFYKLSFEIVFNYEGEIISCAENKPVICREMYKDIKNIIVNSTSDMLYY